MRSIAYTYLNKRECKIQELVYHIQSGQWLTKTYLRVTFSNSNVSGKPFRICLSENEISSLADDTTNAFKQNMLYRYIDRPN